MQGYDTTQPTEASDDQMSGLVERLNHRLNPQSKDIAFRMDHKCSKIIMTAGGEVKASYSRDEVPLLENYLHEMAGLHLSVVT